MVEFSSIWVMNFDQLGLAVLADDLLVPTDLVAHQAGHLRARGLSMSLLFRLAHVDRCIQFCDYSK